MPAKQNPSWFADAGAASTLFPISRFLNDALFATDEGGYGLVLQLNGIDPECVSDEKLAACSASMLQAQRLIGERLTLFQTFIKKAKPFAHASLYAAESPDPAVRETQQARNSFVSGSPFFSISLYWTLYIHPPSHRSKASFEEESQKMLRELLVCTANLVAELAEFGARRLSQAETFQYLAYLARLEDPALPLRSANQISQQLAESSVSWRNPGLVFGEGTSRARFAQPFSLLKRPGATTPAMLSELLSVPAEFILVLESRRKSLADVRSEVRAHENVMEFFKHNPLVLLFHRNKPLPKSASSVAADAALELGGLGGILHDVTQRGLTLCTASLLGLVHAPTETGLREGMSALHRVFGSSEATLLEEGYGALSVYQSLFPGAASQNVRRFWMREDHLANLSLWFSCEEGSVRSETLEDESLCVLQTRNGTPHHFDQFASGPRGVLVMGEPRRGKTFFVNFTVDHEMKYGGYVFIYDVGGSYEHVVEKYGGAVVKVGLHGPRLNPFSLPDTEESRNQTARLVMMLLERGGAHLRPQEESGIRQSVAAIYALENPALRRLRYLMLAPELQPYLAKWIQGGVYADIFDNAEDELRLAHIVSFDFEGLAGEDQKILMEPLLFWIRLRVNALIRAEGNLALPKLEVYDEVWRLIKDETVLAAIFETMKTAGKKLGGLILATQDTHDLGPHADVIRNACPDAVFLGGAFDRERYRSLFSMNERQLDLIPTLRRGEMLLLRRHYAKVVQLVVDEASKWLYSTHPQDVRRRAKAIHEHGREKAFEMLALSASAK